MLHFKSKYPEHTVEWSMEYEQWTRARMGELEAKLERYEKALEFYTRNEVWQLNGACDPNSGNFSGVMVAINALLDGEQDG